MKIVSLDRERALRLARVVRSWHRLDDEEGAFDCFAGMAIQGVDSEEELVDIWGEATQQVKPYHDPRPGFSELPTLGGQQS
jgi:hypothetical protein